MNRKEVLVEILLQYKVSQYDEIQTMERIEKLYSKTERNKTDFIDRIINLFAKRYYESRQFEFEMTNQGKERNAAGKLLKRYKEKPLNKLKDTEECLNDIDRLFQFSLSLKEKYYYEGMSISFIYSNLNRIKIKMINGRKTNELNELSEIVNRQFR